eukprot:405147-Rhodomonas_salina.1
MTSEVLREFAGWQRNTESNFAVQRSGKSNCTCRTQAKVSNRGSKEEKKEGAAHSSVAQELFRPLAVSELRGTA